MPFSSSTYAPPRRDVPAHTAHRHALPGGYRLLWYRTERVLGQGGFGITYLATDTNLDRQVALKEFLPIDLVARERDHSVHPITESRTPMYRWGLERFVAEARALARFKHPNIVQVHTVFEANNTAYMVMEYEQGDNLEKLFSANRYLNQTELLALVFPLLDGLEHMHAAGFIHRDIKPSNIYVRSNGSPVLLDFGSARVALGTHTRTLTGLVTPGYAPYEQYGAQGARQGPWGDIYALGATLYRAIANKPPTDAILRGEAQLDRRRDPLIPAVEVGKGRYDPRFLQAIDEALRFSPSERPQSIAVWRRSFPPLTTAPAPRTATRRWLRLTAEFATIGALGVVLGLALVMYFFPQKDSPATRPVSPALAERAVPSVPEPDPSLPTSKSPAPSSQAPPETSPTPPPVASVERTVQPPPAPEPPVEPATPRPQSKPVAQPEKQAGPASPAPTSPLPMAASQPASSEAPKPASSEAPKPTASQQASIAPRKPQSPPPAAEPAPATLQTALADYQRALQYASGQNAPKDLGQAAVWFRKAAEQGYADAQYQLAMLYEQGNGIPQDVGQAAHWYEKAANQGVAAAQHNLAVLYDQGRGVQADAEAAGKWYTKAAALGLPAAQTGLALLYEKGKGVAQDFQQAARWYRAAAAQGWVAAQYNLGLLYDEGKGVEQDYQQALAWYEKAAKEGLAPAQFSLGLLYDEGKGVAQDYRLAAQWYRQAAEQGYDKAQANLGYLYGMGHGVPQDDRQAYAWFALAATRGNRQASRNRDLAAEKLPAEALRQAKALAEDLRARYGSGSR